MATQPEIVEQLFEVALALKDQVRRVVYASSAAVHGPQAEVA